MVHSRLMRRFSTGVLVMLIGLLALAIVPMFIPHGHRLKGTSSDAGAAVVLLPENQLATPSRPRQLSAQPSLVLKGGTLATDPTDQSGRSGNRLLLDGPILMLDASAAPVEPGSMTQSRAPTASDLIAPLLEQLTSFGFDSLVIRRGQLEVVWASRREHLTDIDATITSNRRNSVTRTEPVGFKGQFTFRGQRLDFDAALVPSERGERRGESALTLNMKSALVTLQFDGRIGLDPSLSLTGPIDIATSKAPQLVQWLGLEAMPTTAANDLSLKADLEWRGGTLALHTLTGKLDGQPVTGRLSLNRATPRAKLEGTLAFQAVDLTPFVAALLREPTEITQLESKWQNLVTTGTLVKSMDFDLRLSAARPTLRQQALKPLALTVIVANGKLQADLPALDLSGLRGSVQLSLDTTNSGQMPKTAIRSRFETTDVAPFARAVLGADVISGPSMVMVDLQGNGADLAQVLRTAVGRVHVSTLGPVRLAGDVRGLRVEALKASSPLPTPPNTKPRSADFGWGQAARRASTVDRIELKAQLSQGTLTLDTGRFDVGGVSHAVSGQLNLVTETISALIAQLSPTITTDNARGSTGRLTPSADRLSESDPISISGPWANPAIQLDRPQTRP